MKLPPGYSLVRVLSPGPATTVMLALDVEGTARLVKQAAIARAVGVLAHEGAVLRALARAGVEGVPRLVGDWGDAIAMEWLPLATLGEQGEYGGPMRLDARFREKAARATFARLEAIHEAGVVHGDLSPGNVFVACDGAAAAIADFGLAAWDGATRSTDGAFRGTLLYVAPEVARGESFGPPADDFALAASLLHMATGIPLRAVAADGSGAASVAPLLVDAGSRPFDASHPWHRRARELFPGAMADALLQCLADDARDRPRGLRAVVERGA